MGRTFIINTQLSIYLSSMMYLSRFVCLLLLLAAVESFSVKREEGCVHPETGIYYRADTPVPDPDPCKSCYCIEGYGLGCASIMCDLLTCDEGEVLMGLPGSCCPVCQR